jgi:hypothetical protein
MSGRRSFSTACWVLFDGSRSHLSTAISVLTTSSRLGVRDNVPAFRRRRQDEKHRSDAATGAVEQDLKQRERQSPPLRGDHLSRACPPAQTAGDGCLLRLPSGLVGAGKIGAESSRARGIDDVLDDPLCRRCFSLTTAFAPERTEHRLHSGIRRRRHIDGFIRSRRRRAQHLHDPTRPQRSMSAGLIGIGIGFWIRHPHFLTLLTLRTDAPCRSRCTRDQLSRPESNPASSACSGRWSSVRICAVQKCATGGFAWHDSVSRPNVTSVLLISAGCNVVLQRVGGLYGAWVLIPPCGMKQWNEVARNAHSLRGRRRAILTCAFIALRARCMMLIEARRPADLGRQRSEKPGPATRSAAPDAGPVRCAGRPA